MTQPAAAVTGFDLAGPDVVGIQLDPADLVAAHHDWCRGELRPAAVTAALDAAHLDGPLVDLALGVVEPTVDRWEAGELYPRWCDVLALFHLTGRTPTQLLHTTRLEVGHTSLRFHLTPADLAATTARDALRYPPHVVAATTGAPR